MRDTVPPSIRRIQEAQDNVQKVAGRHDVAMLRAIAHLKYQVAIATREHMIAAMEDYSSQQVAGRPVEYRFSGRVPR